MDFGITSSVIDLSGFLTVKIVASTSVSSVVVIVVVDVVGSGHVASTCDARGNSEVLVDRNDEHVMLPEIACDGESEVDSLVSGVDRSITSVVLNGQVADASGSGGDAD